MKTIALAAAASVALASTASANFSVNEMGIAGSTADLGQLSVDGPATVEVFDYHLGQKGALLGATELNVGANYDVRVGLGKRPIHDVIAVLTVNGQIVDTQDIDLVD